MKFWDPMLLSHLKMERTEWDMFIMEKGLKIMKRERAGRVLPKRALKLREKFVCRVLREVRKQIFVDSLGKRTYMDGSII